MLGSLRGVSPGSEAMSDETLDRNRAEKALITKTPIHNQQKTGIKNYSDKNGNDVTKAVHKGRKTFAFWTLVCLLLVLAIGNLILTFTIIAVLRLGHGLESMEFLPEHNAVKFFGSAELEHVYKRDGRLESFRDEPLRLASENGSVVFSLQTRLSRADTRLTVNTSGVFVRGAGAFELRDPASGEVVFSSAGGARCSLPGAVSNLHARQISTKRISSGSESELSLRAEGAAALRGAEGARLEARQLLWSADQDIHIRSVNGSVVLSGKEGVYIDVRYLPVAGARAGGAAQYKVCVCMPQGRLFRVPPGPASPPGQPGPPSPPGACARVLTAGGRDPCA